MKYSTVHTWNYNNVKYTLCKLKCLKVNCSTIQYNITPRNATNQEDKKGGQTNKYYIKI